MGMAVAAVVVAVVAAAEVVPLLLDAPGDLDGAVLVACGRAAFWGRRAAAGALLGPGADEQRLAGQAKAPTRGKRRHAQERADADTHAVKQ